MEEQVARFADMLAAMGAEPRLRIVRALLSAHPEGLVVGEIQSELGIPASTLSHHLDKLTPNVAHGTRRSIPTRSSVFVNSSQEGNAQMNSVKEVVREKYGEAALRVVSGEGSASCGSIP